MARIHAFGPMTFSGIQDGRSRSFGPLAVSVNRMPNDPIGMTTVIFDGVAAGCEIRVYDPELNEVAGIETCAENQALSWLVFASGSPRNNLRVKIINVAYKIKDFPYTARVGEQSVPVQLESDNWYRNP